MYCGPKKNNSFQLISVPNLSVFLAHKLKTLQSAIFLCPINLNFCFLCGLFLCVCAYLWQSKRPMDNRVMHGRRLTCILAKTYTSIAKTVPGANNTGNPSSPMATVSSFHNVNRPTAQRWRCLTVKTARLQPHFHSCVLGIRLCWRFMPHIQCASLATLRGGFVFPIKIYSEVFSTSQNPHCLPERKDELAEVSPPPTAVPRASHT